MVLECRQAFAGGSIPGFDRVVASTTDNDVGVLRRKRLFDTLQWCEVSKQIKRTKREKSFRTNFFR